MRECDDTPLADLVCKSQIVKITLRIITRSRAATIYISGLPLETRVFLLI